MENDTSPALWELKEQPLMQLLGLLIIWLGMAIVSATLLQFLVQYWGWESFSVLMEQTKKEPVDATVIDQMRWLQLFAHLGNYTIVALIFAGWFYGKRAPQELRLHQIPNPLILVLCVGLTIALFPIISWFYYWNTMLLPEAWIAQDRLALQRLFLTMDKASDFYLNLALLGGAAALGEELIFRGVMQTILTKWTKSVHVGSWVTGVLFSLIHFQWEGFVPRLLMGVFFCYVFWYTQSLWVPLLLHSFFNSIQVIIPYFYSNAIETSVTPQAVSLYSFGVALGLFSILWVLFLKHKKIIFN